MLTLEFAVIVLLGFLSLWLLRSVFPLLRTQLAIAFLVMTDLRRRAFQQAGRLLTDEGTLSLSRTVAQVGGSMVNVAAGLVFALCDFQLTLATLGPMFGRGSSGEIFSSFDLLLGPSAILLAVVYGLMLTDLLGWTSMTRFAVIERGRSGAFCLILICFLTALILAPLMAWYRQVAMMAGEIEASAQDAAVWIQVLPGIILVTLATLLFVAVAFAFMSLETFFSAVIALLLAGAGVGLSIGYGVLKVVDLVVEVALASATSLPEATQSLTRPVQGGARTVTTGVAKARQSVATKLGNLVRLERREAIASPKGEV